MKCPKCYNKMKWSNGYASGPHGPDIENCRNPYFKCVCGYEIEDCEPEPK